MKILAVGATGFIGAHVVRLLTEQGHDVIVLHRGNSDCQLFPELQHVHASHHVLPTLRAELERLSPEVVLDVILYTQSHALELAEACRGVTGRIVALSSSDVYRNYDGFRGQATAAPDPVPLAENAPLRERLYPYRGHDLRFKWADEYEKLHVERVILGQPDLLGTVLRLPAVYGPGDSQHRILTHLRVMDSGRPKLLMAKDQSAWRWTRGYVENVAAAIALAVADDRAGTRIYNLGEEAALTEREWVEAIGEAAQWSGEVEEVAADELPAELRQSFDFRYDLATDTSRVRAELSYLEPVTPSDALKRTVEWERSRLIGLS